MRRARKLFAIAALLSGTALSASQDQLPPPNAAAKAAEITVVGCLVRLDTSAWRPGTTDPVPAGHPGQPVSSGYAVKNAAVVSSDRAPATGPVSTRSDREFGIVKGDVNVAGFAGHQVEITGRLTSTAPAGDSSTDATRVSPGQDVLIDVSAVRSISDDCPPRD